MKRLKIMLFIIVFMRIFGINAFAAEINTDELYDSLGIDSSEINELLPDDAREIMSENDITLNDAGKFTDVTFSEVIKYILEKYKNEIKYPMKIFGISLGIIILSAVCSMFSEANNSCEDTKKVYEIVCSLICAVAICVPCSECIEFTKEVISSCSAFMLTYVPIYAGIAAASGSVTSAGIYNMTLITVCDGANVIFVSVILPLVCCLFALGAVDSVNGSISLSGITRLVNKVCTFFLVGIMTLFTGLISLQSTLANNADSAIAKTAKLAVSNFVPVVGGALSDTYSAVKSGLIVLKGAGGIYGIIAVFLIVLPPLIKILGLYITMYISETFSEILGLDFLCKIFKNAVLCMGIVLGILMCFAALLIIATAILLMKNPSQ